MKLSDIQTSARYPVTIPSTGVATSYRPFLVREERALMIAQNSESAEVQLATLESIVRACVTDCPDRLTTFDVEYLFVLFRNQAVGEMADAVATCGSCGAKKEVSIDLSKVQLTASLGTKLKLSSELIVEMTYPSIQDLSSLIKITNEIERKLKTVACALKTVYFGNEVFNVSEMDAHEIDEFLMNRTDDEFTTLNDWIENIPTVFVNQDYVCDGCETKNTISLKTLADFF
jgi:hypothetical protein